MGDGEEEVEEEVDEVDDEAEGIAEVEADVVMGTEVSSGASMAGGASPLSRFLTRPMMPRRAGSGFRASCRIE